MVSMDLMERVLVALIEKDRQEFRRQREITKKQISRLKESEERWERLAQTSPSRPRLNTPDPPVDAAPDGDPSK